jgi:hypothetical protein
VTETTQTTIVREDPAIEQYRTGLLEYVSQFIRDNLANMPPPPVSAPAYQVAGLTPLQQQAAQMAQMGIGMYAPYVQQAAQLGQKGAEGVETFGFGGLQEGLGATREGQEMLAQAAARANLNRNVPFGYQQRAANYLRGASDMGRDVLGTGRQDIETALGEYSPADRVQAFMNPFEDEVVQRTLADIRREGDIREQGLQAQAAAAGAFGGSRQAVAEQELARNVLDQQAKAAGQLRQAGFGQASQQAQQAFEAAKQRQMGGAQLGGQLGMQAAGLEQSVGQQLGQLGLGYGGLEQQNIAQMMGLAGQSGQFGQQLGQLAGLGGQLGQTLSGLGTEQAGLGQLVQNLYGQDVKTLEAFGARDQALQQALADATRMSNMQLYQAPYQQYSFLSDIYKGVPGSQQSVTVSSGQDPSPFQQIAGLGIAGLSAAAGANRAGLFG